LFTLFNVPGKDKGFNFFNSGCSCALQFKAGASVPKTGKGNVKGKVVYSKKLNRLPSNREQVRVSAHCYLRLMDV